MSKSHLYSTVSTIKQRNAEFDRLTECPVGVVTDDKVNHQVSSSLFVQQTLH